MNLNNQFLEKITFNTIFDDLYYCNYRRIQMFRKIEPKEGYVIGHCYKYDGDYHTPCKPRFYGDEYEPGGLENRISIKYWIVAVSMNEQYLVPRHEIEEWRFDYKLAEQKYFGTPTNSAGGDKDWI